MTFHDVGADLAGARRDWGNFLYKKRDISIQDIPTQPDHITLEAGGRRGWRAREAQAASPLSAAPSVNTHEVIMMQSRSG